jgi:hypothetical protein
METIVVVPRVDRQIGYEMGECMACLANAGIRDYTVRLERSILFWVHDRTFAKAVKVLVDGGFKCLACGRLRLRSSI